MHSIEHSTTTSSNSQKHSRSNRPRVPQRRLVTLPTAVLRSPRMSANQANTSGQVTLRRDVRFNGVKVFSATMVADRDQLGEKVSAWMANHPQLKVTDIVVTQSSDEAFHCIAITVFYWEDTDKRR